MDVDRRSDVRGLYTTLTSLDIDSFENDHDRQRILAAARSLCTRIENPMETLLRTAWIEPAYTACLKIGVDIGLFAALGDDLTEGRSSVKELVERTSTDEALLERVLRMLASMGTIGQSDTGDFRPTRLSKALIERPCSATVDYRYVVSNPMFQQLPAFLQERNYQTPVSLLDTPWQPAVNTKSSFFEWLGQDAAALEVFTSHMAGYTSQRGTWQDVYPVRERLLHDSEGATSEQDVILADIGGGAGHDLKRFAASFFPTSHEACLVLQDLPEVINQVRRDGTLPSSMMAVPIDFTKEAPVPGARAYYMHSVLHDWPDDAVVDILKRMHPVLSRITRNGHTPKLLINENVLLKRGVPPQAAALDLIMMSAFASRERTEEQWRALLDSAGYRVAGIFSKAGIDEAIIEAEAIP